MQELGVHNEVISKLIIEIRAVGMHPRLECDQRRAVVNAMRSRPSDSTGDGFPHAQSGRFCTIQLKGSSKILQRSYHALESEGGTPCRRRAGWGGVGWRVIMVCAFQMTLRTEALQMVLLTT